MLSVLTLSILTLALAAASGAAQTLPSYPADSDVLGTVPSADEGALGAMFNPAVWGVMERGELDFWWSDRDVRRHALDNWGLAFGRNLGFSARRHDFRLGDRPANVTDLQIGLGGGTRARAMGIAYGWSAGNAKEVGREDFLTVGSVARPAAWLSTGLIGRLALGRPGSEAVADLAVRPLGTPLLVAFADYALARKQTLDQGALSGGVAVRPFPGLQGAVKWREGGSFQVSVGLALGRLGTQAISGYDTEGSRVATHYVVRANPQLRGADLAGLLGRGRSLGRMDLHGALVYQKARYGEDGLLALRDLTEQLRFAREDPTVGAVALNLSGLAANPEMIWELRRSLEAVRAAGKKVVVYCDQLDLSAYYLASAADRIVLDPTGVLLVPGVATSRTYLKELLAKAGIGFDEWRFLKYKSAMESYSRDRMSEADREQRQALIDDAYAEFASGITASGRMTRAVFDSTVNDRPLLLAGELLRRGWVDRLGHWEDVEKVAEAAAGHGLRGASLAVLKLRRTEPDETWGEPPAVALVYALGECAMDTGIRGRATSRALRGFRGDPRVKAVVLRADSPGGEITPSDLIAYEMRKLREARKPVFVSQGRVAASGGYWISMEGDTITVSPFTITGSIGVIGGWFWNEGLGRKLGLTSDHVQVGRSADLLSGLTVPLVGVTVPERNLDERERGLMRETILGEYADFTQKVASARRLDLSYVREIAEGHAYSGRAGIERKIVDRVATLEETIDAARRAAGIPARRPVRVIEYPKPPLFRMPSFALPVVRALGLARGGGAAPDDDTALARFLPRDYAGRVTESLIRNPGRPMALTPADLLPDETPVTR